MESKNSVDPSGLSGISANFDGLDGFDDSVAFNNTFDDGAMFSGDWDTETLPYNGNLYSTPLSWDPPETKVEPLQPAPYTTLNTLTQAQQEKLRSIAMPQHLQYRGEHSPKSTTNSVSSPEGCDNSRKRKSSASADEEDEDSPGQHPPVKKTAHNMIEKRYRTNLNDKIAALRDSVPSLRIMSKSARGEDTNDDKEDLQGLTPAHKLNKATVLSKATEYIHHLEKRTRRLQEENVEQKSRLAAFETLFRAGSMPFNPPPPITSPFQFPPGYNTPGQSPVVDPQGMIQVPEDIRRLHGHGSQQTFAVPQEQFHQARQPVGPTGWPANAYFGKLMVGTLAGLMIMEGFSEMEQTTDTPGGRGLFALPVHLIRTLSQTLRASFEFNIMGFSISAVESLAYMKLFLVVGALLSVFLPSVFSRQPKPKSGKTQSVTLSAAPSLASSIQVRRQAWDTAIQTVWVPRHNFFLEAAALLLKTAKLSIRNFIGGAGYAYITGVTQQQEVARVKAWEIALDAQLAGGDVEVSKSRLTLTLMASGTLPDTPARLMLKALHIRVLLWEVGNAWFNGYYLFHEIAAKLARRKWNEAKQLHLLTNNSKDEQESDLPDHLVALLELECDEVLSDSIGQRAYNLAWNLPTTHNVDTAINGMDDVVDDFAIRSPLDAVAAWYSSLILHRALIKTLEPKEKNDEVTKSIAKDVTLAVKVAPVASRSQARALIARAVLVKEKRGASIAVCLKALGAFEPKGEAPTLINTRSSMASILDARISINCAAVIAYLERFPSPQNPVAAHGMIQNIMLSNLTVLGFTATFQLMERIYEHEKVASSCSAALENLAGTLRVWIGGSGSEKSGLEKTLKRNLVERCLTVTKNVVGMEKDAGYESMSEDADEGC